MTASLPDEVITVIDAPNWRTPVTGITGELGNARLQPTTYGRGYYRMEGVGGHEFYRVAGGRLPVTQLQRREVGPRGRLRWKTWMVDDPLHWYGMWERVMLLPPGDLVVAGLGLGLFAHHLLDRPDITRVRIIEIDPDVAGLVEKTLPPSDRFEVHLADYYRYIEYAERPDAVLWDLAVGDTQMTRLDFYRAALLTDRAWPGIHLSCFGLRDKALTIVRKE